MTRIVPYNNDFLSVERNELFSKAILFCSVALSFIILIIDNGKFTLPVANLLLYLNSLSAFLAICYFFSDIIGNYLFQQAEIKRRNDFFDNSLQTKLSEQSSIGYFSNDNISPSVRKLGVNCFENVYFSKSISARMFKAMFLWSALIVSLFLIAALCTSHELFILILQLALPLVIIQKTIRLFIYNKRCEEIFEKFKSIFSSPAGTEQTEIIIHNMTSYESNQAWASIKLESQLFLKMNDELSISWQEIKKKYNII